MKKILVFFLFIVLVGKYSHQYLNSQEFYDWADKSKSPWTCYYENFLGQMLMVTSDYDDAMVHFGRVSNRCQKSAASEVADFSIAKCLEGIGSQKQAQMAYAKFSENYPSSKRAQVALKASQLLK